MEKLHTSLTIIRHSFVILGRNPRLLVFPLVSLVAAVVVYAFFFVPVMLHMSFPEIWRALWNPGTGWASLGPWHLADAGGSPWLATSFFGLAAYYLLAIFVMTFVNVALYSQIISAMNGSRVSVARGLALASRKLPAIARWTLLAGTVGLVLRAIQERIGFLGRWIGALAGLSWSMASVFVIPVIINEPRTRNPFDYLKISSSLIRRTWGEGIIGLGGIGLAAVAVFVVLLAIQLALMAVVGHEVQIVVITSLVSLGVFSLMYLAYQIFECGLYVYATEGVAPGSFDEKTFDRVWTVRPGSGSGDRPEAAPRFRWSRLWLLVPAAIACASLVVPRFIPEARRVTSKTQIGSARINLADLDYALTMDDLHAAGLFVGDKCPKCDFSADGYMTSSFIGKAENQFQPIMYKHEDRLYLHFYGEDVEGGRQRVRQSLQVLRSRFPGHEAAIDVLAGFMFEWDTVPGAVSYTLEVDCLDCCQLGSWCTDAGTSWKLIPDVKRTSYGLEWIGERPGRWRVWHIDAQGQPGPKSGWTTFNQPD